MKKLFLSTFIFLTITAHAQPPGFQGKRLSLNYNINFFPFSGWIFEDKIADQSAKRQIGFDYVVTRNSSIGLAAELLNSYVYLDKKGLSQISITNFDTIRTLDNIKSQANFYGGTFLFKYKRYKYDSKGAIAPLGRYTLWEVGYSFYGITDDGRFNGGTARIPLDYSYSAFVASLGMGQQSIYLGKIILDIAVKFGLSTSYFADTNSDQNNNPYTDYNQPGKPDLSQIERKANEKQYLTYLMNINIGVGYLLGSKNK